MSAPPAARPRHDFTLTELLAAIFLDSRARVLGIMLAAATASAVGIGCQQEPPPVIDLETKGLVPGSIPAPKKVQRAVTRPGAAK